MTPISSGLLRLGLDRLALKIAAALALLPIGWTMAAGAETPPEHVAFFESKVRPLLVERCYECHGEARQDGGLRLDARSGWQEGGGTGPSLTPGRPDQSLLIQVVRGQVLDRHETAHTKLTGGEIETLVEWVRLGAPDPRGDLAAKGPVAQAPAARQQHWAFQPITQPQPPQVTDRAWPRSPIDHFVLATLEANDLKPVADADRNTWLRRVTFDLTGLPPTPEEVVGFASDAFPQARDRVVDRLLASVAFGERWARHWLDLVGYADQLGTVNDVPAPHAWRYRDFVIRALNTDKPFDRFLREQIAGDLLPADTIEARQDALTATGFLLLGEIHIVTADKLQLRADIADHQIQKVGTAFLGLSLGCARCHDHKFDPIRLADYYGLAGIFGSSESAYMTERGVWSSILTAELPETPEERADREAALRQHAETVAGVKAERGELKKKIDEVTQLIAGAEKRAGAVPAGLAAAAGDAARSPTGTDANKDVPPVDLKARQAELEGQVARLDTRLLHLAYIEPKAALAYCIRDAAEPADWRITIRGNVHAPGETAPRGFIRAVSPAPWAPIPPGASGRAQLADWLAGAGNPLPARVTVNRIWQKLLGEGLVRTVDYFGVRGERPTHPELLDWLAGELIRNGWSQKKLIRTIVLSRAYGLGSEHDPAAAARDPDNRLLWRMTRRRLDAESLRDAVLSVSGELCSSVGGPALALGFLENVGGLDPKDVNPVSFRTNRFPDEQHHCRTIYLPVVRSRAQPGPAELLNLFDFVPPTEMAGQRPATSVPTQALFLLNSEFMKFHAERLAGQVLRQEASSLRERLQELYLRTLNRPVTEPEVEAAAKFLDTDSEPEKQRAAWAAYGHAMLASNEFLFRL